MQQDAEATTKKLDKARVDLQVAFNANITLKAKLHIARGAIERQNTKMRELTKKLMAFEDAYLDLLEKYSPLLVEKETLEKDAIALRSNVGELTTEVD